MPGLSPADTFIWKHPDDRTLHPSEQKRTITFRHGSVRDWRTFRNRYAAVNSKDDDSWVDDLVDLVAGQAVECSGPWREVNGELIPRSDARADVDVRTVLETAFTPASLMQLAASLPTCATISELDKKKSESPSPSGAAGSAPTATLNPNEESPAHASTAPANTSPSNSNVQPAPVAAAPPATTAVSR